MAHKGFNGRIIAMWLGNCLELAAKHSTVSSRNVGQWLRKKYDEEGQPWPDDAPHADTRFPLICFAMLLGANPESYLSCDPLFDSNSQS